MRERIGFLLLVLILVAPGCRALGRIAVGAAIGAAAAALDDRGCERPGR